MRPRNVEEFVGQRHLLAPDRLVRRILEGGEPVSMILWGPPGSGKTTLARLLADAVQADFVALSAVQSGVKDVREVAADAARRRRAGRRTLLFLDEIHRFNKAQQDAFLPHVESGDLILVGATTENPSFELVSPLLSRCRVVTLEPLSRDDLEAILRHALKAPSPRGLGGRGLALEDGVLGRLAGLADGDARVALNTLETAAELASASGDGGRVGLEEVAEALQRRVPRTDKGGEGHFNLISALHKSVRNSDPDAGLYWLARMLEAGEDPRYVARRLVRMASEDVGLADPDALQVAVTGFQAFHVSRLPEGALALAQVVVYLALAPKSDAVYRAYGEACRDANEAGDLPVPLQLRNAPTALMKELGYGEGYRHAHDQPGGVAAMDCLPEELADRRYYRPTDRGREAELGRRARDLHERRSRGEPPGRSNADSRVSREPEAAERDPRKPDPVPDSNEPDPRKSDPAPDSNEPDPRKPGPAPDSTEPDRR